MLDPREFAFRPTIAASYLQGIVAADQFSDGVVCSVTDSVLPLKNKPNDQAELVSEMLFGEKFIVYERQEAWAWGQSQTDGYVGFVKINGLSDQPASPTHEVKELKTFVYQRPDIKSPVIKGLSMGSRVSLKEKGENFICLKEGGWIVEKHVVELNVKEASFIAVAKKYIGTPYLWGGRSSNGLDCSALVQLSLSRVGILMPRDTDQQEKAVGCFFGKNAKDIKRGDLLYTQGHVAIASANDLILHATAYHMQVVEEPLKAFLSRLDETNHQLRSIKRLKFPVSPD